MDSVKSAIFRVIHVSILALGCLASLFLWRHKNALAALFASRGRVCGFIIGSSSLGLLYCPALALFRPLGMLFSMGDVKAGTANIFLRTL